MKAIICTKCAEKTYIVPMIISVFMAICPVCRFDKVCVDVEDLGVRD